MLNCCSLSNLENLELRENVLKTWPASMALLSKLKVLDLGSNLLEDLVRTWFFIGMCGKALDGSDWQF